MITTVPGQGTYDLGVEIGLMRSATVDAGHHVVLHHTPGPPSSYTKDATGMPAYFWVNGTEVTFCPAPSEVWEVDFRFYGPLQQAVWPVPVDVDPVDAEFTKPRVQVTEGPMHMLAPTGKGTFGTATTAESLSPTGGPMPDDLSPHSDDQAIAEPASADPDLDDATKPPAA